MLKVALFLVGILSGGGVVYAQGNNAVFEAMEDEIERSRHDLKIDMFGPPYYIKYQVRDRNRAEVTGSFGALIGSDSYRKRTLFVDVKVGTPQFDSSTPGSHQFSIEQFIPLDDDPEALRQALWFETDLRYKQAIINYLKKKGRFIGGGHKSKLAEFAKEGPPKVFIKDIPVFDPPMARWEKLVRKVSARFKTDPTIEKSRVRVYAERIVRYFLDSEGNRVRDASINYGIQLEAWSKTDSGSPVHDQETLYFSSLEKMPSKEILASKIDDLVAGINQLRHAPKMEPFVGPAIFAPDATAVLFHEAVGHRLEGDRLRTAEDGKTFINKIGKRILPEFLTIVDNPRMETFHHVDLAGHYDYDDEGQEGQKVLLVENGILRNFLMSRTPLPKFNHTNGHARSDGLKYPVARMSNFVVNSTKEVDKKELKKRLIDEVRKQGKPYGIMIRKIVGGETDTRSKSFQVFKGNPLYLFKVYPDGREELVRGVEFVGTPLSMIGKIIMTGNDYQVINAVCGAESGQLPVTSIAPSLLLSEVELQNSHENQIRPPILPPPPVKIQ